MSGDPRETLRAIGTAAWADVDMTDVRERAARRRRRRRTGTLAAVLALPVLLVAGLLLAPRDGRQPPAVLPPPVAGSVSPPPATPTPLVEPGAPSATSSPAPAPATQAAPAPAVTATEASSPSGSPPSGSPPAAVPPPDGAVPAAGSIAVEAEAAELAAPMQRFADPQASGGQYVGVEDGTGEPRQGEAVFAFEVTEPGRFALWARVKGPDTASNSFFVVLDGGDRRIWHVPGPGDEEVSSAWVWAPVEVGDGAQRQVVELGAGSHRLQVLNRQDGTLLDLLALTTDLSGAPPPP